MNVEEALLFKVELDRIKESEKRLCSFGNLFLTIGVVLAVLLIIYEFLSVIDGTGTHTLFPYAVLIIFIFIDIICWIIAGYTYGAQYQSKLNGLRIYVEIRKEKKKVDKNVI